MEDTSPLIALPIQHISPSAARCLRDNPLQFKKQYVLNIWNNDTTPSMLRGSAVHKAIEYYYTNPSDTKRIDNSINAGMLYINASPDNNIKWGKTGNREKLTKEYVQAFNFWLKDKPNLHKVAGIEESITTYIQDANGDTLPLAVKVKTDLVHESSSGELEIIDWKVVSSFIAEDEDDYDMIFQAMFNFHAVRGQYNKGPKRMRFVQIKPSQNKDGSPQVEEYVVSFDNPIFHHAFYKLYGDIIRMLMGEVVFLPSFQSALNKEDTWVIYTQDLISAEMPVGVVAAPKEKKFVDKKFVESAPDAPQTAELTVPERIQSKLLEFGLPSKHAETHTGPTVSMYTFVPSRGVSMNAIQKRIQDIQLATQSKSPVRVVAPIPGTKTFGVEVQNQDRKVMPYTKGTSTGTIIPIGVNSQMQTVYEDITKMPHLLVAGATGAGKSTFLHALISNLTENNSPDDVQLALIDPKRVEMGQYRTLPHLIAPVAISVPESGVLMAQLEVLMNERYEMFDKIGVANIEEYNKKKRKNKLPKIVVVIDEFADIILTSKIAGRSQKTKDSIALSAHRESAKQIARQRAKFAGKFLPTEDMPEMDSPMTFEEAMISIAQKGRASGIHLIVGTQRPSVDVVKGILKANIPARICFRVSSTTDSKVIIDEIGAETLLGAGDMLYKNQNGIQRLQGFKI